MVTGQMQSNGLLSRLLVEMTIIASSQFPHASLSVYLAYYWEKEPCLLCSRAGAPFVAVMLE